MRALVKILLGAALVLGAVSARADIYVIVNGASPVQSMTRKEAVDLFMGRSHTFANGDFALAFDLPRDSGTRSDFYAELTGMSLAQVNSYWARLMFTGQTMPPTPLPGEAAMIEVIKRNPSAIGYLAQEPAEKGVRVILVLKKK